MPTNREHLLISGTSEYDVNSQLDQADALGFIVQLMTSVLEEPMNEFHNPVTRHTFLLIKELTPKQVWWRRLFA